MEDRYTWDYMWEGLDENFKTPLEKFIEASTGKVRIISGFRDEAYQADLFADGITKYEPNKVLEYKQFLAQNDGNTSAAVAAWLEWNGGAGAVGKWVARPGASNHNSGVAADLRFVGPDAQKWAHDNAGRFGLVFPMAHEEWHVEPAGLRTGTYQKQDQTTFEVNAEAYTVPPPGIPHAMDGAEQAIQGSWIASRLRGPAFTGDLAKGPSEDRLLRPPQNLAALPDPNLAETPTDDSSEV